MSQTREVRNAVMGAVQDALRVALSESLARGLAKVALAQKDPLAALALRIVAGQVREHGPDLRSSSIEALLNAVKGGPAPTLDQLRGVDAAELSELTDKLQAAEDERRAIVAQTLRGAVEVVRWAVSVRHLLGAP